MTAQGTGDGGSQEKQATAGAIADMVEEAVKKAPARDVGLFLKMIGVAVFLIALGIAISFVMRGTVSFSTKADVKVGNELDKDSTIKTEQKLEGVQSGTTVSKTVTVSKEDKK